MTMLSAASMKALRIAVMIQQARTAHWLRSERVYDDNAVGGIVEDAAHGCDDKQACAAHWDAMPSLWRSAHRVFKVK